MKEKECCPEFNSKLWDRKVHKWKNKLFIKDSMPTFFHVPFPWIIGKKISRLCNVVMKEKTQLSKDKWLMLFYDPSPFKSELYMTTTKSISGESNVKISGEFHSMVFDGPYKDVPKFMKEMDAHLLKLKLKAKKYYVHYAYCPKCSKKYGHNYMILFAEV